MDKEKWIAVQGFDLYEVSNLGNLRRKEHAHICGSSRCASPFKRKIKAKILKTPTAPTGYACAVLCYDGNKKWSLIHR
jgi:hypothetical protein